MSKKLDDFLINKNSKQDYFIILNNYFSNIADKCINYAKDDNFHFKPYFFCKICKFQYCYNCICSHIEKNFNDNKHKIDNIISENSVYYDTKKYYNDILKIRKNILYNISNNEKEIKIKKNKLLQIKYTINKTIDILDNYYDNVLEDIKNLFINEKQFIEGIIKKLYEMINIKDNKKYNIENDNFENLLKNMEILNESKNLFNEKFTYIIDYCKELKNNINVIKKSNLKNIYYIINDYYKKEFEENLLFSINNIKNNYNNYKKYINKKRKKDKKNIKTENRGKNEKENLYNNKTLEIYGKKSFDNNNTKNKNKNILNDIKINLINNNIKRFRYKIKRRSFFTK